jgi:hypothetical protein
MNFTSMARDALSLDVRSASSPTTLYNTIFMHAPDPMSREMFRDGSLSDRLTAPRQILQYPLASYR